jgi:hypothetical protein
MDSSHRERKLGASCLASEISWSHNLRLFLVGVLQKSSVRVCTISANNFWLLKKKKYHNCGELSDARHSPSGVERIQQPSRCYPCGRRSAHWTFLNIIVSIIKWNLRHTCQLLYFWNMDLRNWVYLLKSPYIYITGRCGANRSLHRFTKVNSIYAVYQTVSSSVTGLS